MDIEALFRKRYGGDRFNPAAGQTQMTFREWMDRHPSLQGKTALARDRYHANVQTEAGGQKYLNNPNRLESPPAPPLRGPDANRLAGGFNDPTDEGPAARLGPAVRSDPSGKVTRLDRPGKKLRGARSKKERNKRSVNAALRRTKPDQPKNSKNSPKREH